jgi:hypothetical protein
MSFSVCRVIKTTHLFLFSRRVEINSDVYDINLFGVKYWKVTPCTMLYWYLLRLFQDLKCKEHVHRPFGVHTFCLPLQGTYLKINSISTIIFFFVYFSYSSPSMGRLYRPYQFRIYFQNNACFQASDKTPWTGDLSQGVFFTGRKISASLSYVTVTGYGNMESAWGGGSKTPYALSLGGLPLPLRTSAGWPPTCVFVTFGEARRYLATSINRKTPQKTS